MSRAFSYSISVIRTPVIMFSAIMLALSGQFVVAKEKQTSDSNALASLVKQLSELDSISSSFVQYSVDQKGTRIQESRGEFKAQRPGLFYWHTDQPLEQTIYSDGQNVTVYDPDLEQATVQRMDDRVQSTPALLFSGDIAEIGNQFVVELRQMDIDYVQYLLMPKTKDSLFERLLVRFEGKILSEMRLTDALGQESTVSFIQMQVNPDLPANTFVPDIPPGTDVIRDIPVTSSAADGQVESSTD